MPEVPRISVQEAREKVQSRRALLVCGYEDEEKCNKVKLEGAISFGRFQTALSSLTRDRQAAKYQARGFSERHEEHALRRLNAPMRTSVALSDHAQHRRCDNGRGS